MSEMYKDIDVSNPPMFEGVPALKMKHADLVVARAACMPLLLKQRGIMTAYMHPDKKVVILGKDSFSHITFDRMRLVNAV